MTNASTWGKTHLFTTVKLMCIFHCIDSGLGSQEPPIQKKEDRRLQFRSPVSPLQGCVNDITALKEYLDLFKRTNALIRSKVAAQSPQLEATVLEDLEQPFLGGAIAYTVG